MRFTSEISHQTVDLLAAKIGPGTTVTGAVSAAASGAYVWTEQGVQSAQAVADQGLTLGEWGIIAGIFGVFAGAAIQIYFGWGRQKREREYHAARMQWLHDTHVPPKLPEDQE